ncbi:MAG: 30S ribosomal protein S19e [Candidatus Micrarchaeota archaeon]|nr:30S ribosomal protein S19e [Candidatus Micrarchaeota archaeon]
MSNVYEVKSADLVRIASQRLKEKMKKPTYVDYVKSGPSKERVPQDRDFWFTRSASILRQVYLNGPIGVSKLRTRYGSRKDHVVHRHHHMKAGGSIIRDALIELERLKLVQNTKEGRVITPQGRSFLDKIANELKGARSGA